MISFDQVLLLEERVESAVKKIEQLNAENAALRAKVAELSNALNAKSEQFSTFQSDQSKIEEGILKALSRLNAVENVVLQASGAAQAVSQASSPVQAEQEATLQNPEPSFDTMTVTEQSPKAPETQPAVQNHEEVSETLSPDVDFEFGETEASSDQVQSDEPRNSDSSQPMFDIF